MNMKTVMAAVAVVALVGSGLARAQGNSDREDRGRSDRGSRGEQQDRRDNDARPPQRGQNQGRGRNAERQDERHDERQDERGAGPEHAFHRGGRLPNQYRQNQYVVDDWRGHHLNAPPRGYHWVQTGSDYVLVAITTGIILQLLLSH